MVAARSVRFLGFAALAFTLVIVLVGVMVASLAQQVRDPQMDQLPVRADAVVVFAGEDGRFELGRRLAEESLAPALVLNAADLPDVAKGWCGEQGLSFEVVCIEPDEGGTRGEARAFGRLAGERGWTSLVGVTGDYHTARAGLALRRCHDGPVSMAQLEWGEVSSEVVRGEVLGLLHARTNGQGC